MKLILTQGQTFRPPKVGDIVEGKVIAKKSMALYLDLGVWGVGVIYGKEIKQAREEFRKIKVGDTMLAKIIDLENEDGYIELSIAGASKEIALEMMRQKKDSGEIITVEIMGANKGGLLTKVSGLPAFLPISQLSSEHYPQVEEGETEKILEELKKFIGQEMGVRILGILDDQVILSEKLVSLGEEAKNTEYQIGEIVEGEISGITEYGIFVKIGEKAEGLLPREENNLDLNNFQIGQKIKVKISSLSEGKIILSLSSL